MVSIFYMTWWFHLQLIPRMQLVLECHLYYKVVSFQAFTWHVCAFWAHVHLLTSEVFAITSQSFVAGDSCCASRAHETSVFQDSAIYPQEILWAICLMRLFLGGSSSATFSCCNSLESLCFPSRLRDTAFLSTHALCHEVCVLFQAEKAGKKATSP